MNVSGKELDELVERRLSEGWTWCGSPAFLTPPLGDPRLVWCAEWLPYKDGKRIPHWIEVEN